MVKKILLSIAVAVLLSMTACGKQTSTPAPSQDNTQIVNYEKSVADLTEITLDEAADKIAKNEDLILYLGRPTCKYCRAFVPKLAQAYTDKSITIYYVDTDQADAQKFADFTAHFNIQTVPDFSYYKDKQIVDSLKKGSGSTVEDIKAFLETYGKTESAS